MLGPYGDCVQAHPPSPTPDTRRAQPPPTNPIGARAQLPTHRRSARSSRTPSLRCCSPSSTAYVSSPPNRPSSSAVCPIRPRRSSVRPARGCRPARVYSQRATRSTRDRARRTIALAEIAISPAEIAISIAQIVISLEEIVISHGVHVAQADELLSSLGAELPAAVLACVDAAEHELDLDRSCKKLQTEMHYDGVFAPGKRNHQQE